MYIPLRYPGGICTLLVPGWYMHPASTRVGVSRSGTRVGVSRSGTRVDRCAPCYTRVGRCAPCYTRVVHVCLPVVNPGVYVRLPVVNPGCERRGTTLRGETTILWEKPLRREPPILPVSAISAPFCSTFCSLLLHFRVRFAPKTGLNPVGSSRVRVSDEYPQFYTFLHISAGLCWFRRPYGSS